MNKTKLLIKIIDSIHKLVTSDDYKNTYRLNNSFSRNRKLSFQQIIYLICSNLRKSINLEIASFKDKFKFIKLPDVTKQGFSKARQNISPEAFNKICELFIDKFYSLNTSLNKWNGYNVFAIDGTTLQVPDTEENLIEFGYKSSRHKTKTALATGSAIYDVMNEIIVDAKIDSYPKSERVLAKEHINKLVHYDSKIINKTIITLDRGYPSYEMFDYINEKNLFFVIRLSSSYKLANDITENDETISYIKNGEEKKVRLIKVILENGTEEILATNIFDKIITIDMFKELYFLRWRIETKYRELKSSIKIEEFSGKKPIAIKQDFYASIFLSLITSVIKFECDKAIEQEIKEKKLKHRYQVNRNYLLGEISRKIISLIAQPSVRKKFLDELIEQGKKNRSIIRPNRSIERKHTHPRKTHHYNQKSCI